VNFDFEWPRAFTFPLSEGVIKSENKDFRVIERLPETPSGEGEHLWLTIAKDGQNTAWVARQIAQWANLKQRDVSYAGLKDRHAITEQTFSVHLPGKDAPSIESLNIDGVTILNAQRHIRKLKTGHLIGNHFEIRIRNCSLPLDEIQANWKLIAEQGVPNYFGPQRFGHGGNNVTKGVDWLLKGGKVPRNLQSIYLSAVRSYLFNKLLAQRVSSNTWNTLIDNDFAQFTEGKTGFYCELPEANDIKRCQLGQLSPGASLPGLSKDEFALLDEREKMILEPYSEIIEAIEDRKVSRHFRKLRVLPENAQFSVIEGDPVFSFFLPAGCFATSVIAEVINWQGTVFGAVDWNE